MLPAYIYCICVCFVVSLSLFFRVRQDHIPLRVFPPFLLLTLIAEVWGDYLWQSGRNNIPHYNFFSTFEIAFYLFFLAKKHRTKNIRKAIYILTPIYIVFAFLNIMYFQGYNTFHTISFSVGSLLIVLFSITYFLDLLRLPKSEDLITNPYFWICSGLLFFYICGFPLYGLVNLWADIAPILIDNLSRFINILNIFLYSLFTISFICIRTRKYTL